MIYQILGTLVIFCIVLSWLDLKSHVVYAIIVSAHEGWWKFPLIWFQSFLIPIQCLSTGKNVLDYDLLSTIERGARNILSDNPQFKILCKRNVFFIGNVNDDDDSITFSFPKGDCSNIDGRDRLVPPRIVFLMLACMKKLEDPKAGTKGKTTIFD